MTGHILDNPIWEALRSRHRGIALAQGEVMRYPAHIAPFLGVPREGVEAREALEALLAPGETALLLDRLPRVPEGFEAKKLAMLAQMVCTRPMDEVDGPQIIELGEAHREDVLALTALVYPHYFRPYTMQLGRYFGIYQDGQLAAIIGERMGMDDWQEISAVCTHPEFLGRSYARRLLAMLSNDNLARGRTPFLHVANENARAKELYARGGYEQRCDIAFWSLRRGEA
ncbi:MULTISPECIES: GNAT family N-acetyltransferase [unclassified Lysobacter]|uniref:GNAT family N-acetyltransferase n=1 Tax=unclassified Lysobacter TaxID=2635362 RepID=UPI001C227646|nr:GNAT family N-acetyltransferase [Lysobacter sp. MMG2]MBU8975250.1 GNAT family N-acetyltransferase [Lysobacter sp. MMG2]